MIYLVLSLFFLGSDTRFHVDQIDEVVTSKSVAYEGVKSFAECAAFYIVISDLRSDRPNTAKLIRQWGEDAFLVSTSLADIHGYSPDIVVEYANRANIRWAALFENALANGQEFDDVSGYTEEETYCLSLLDLQEVASEELRKNRHLVGK